MGHFSISCRQIVVFVSLAFGFCFLPSILEIVFIYGLDYYINSTYGSPNVMSNFCHEHTCSLFLRSSMANLKKEEKFRCDCAKFCKLVGGKKVCRSTYYAHAIYRKSLSPVPGGFRAGSPGLEGIEEPGQGPPIADILDGYPHLNQEFQEYWQVRKKTLWRLKLTYYAQGSSGSCITSNWTFTF